MEPLTNRRTTERDALLSRLRAGLEADPRVVAAWLHGSLGRGDADAWSDLDLWVVIDDDAYSDAIRHEFARDVLFIEEAPQNGPAGGTYLMTAHDAPTGAHLVDWYFQPHRFAHAGEDRVILVQRGALPAHPAPAPDREGWHPSAEEDARNKAALAWAMILVQAKYVARKPIEDGMGFDGFLVSLLRDVAAFQRVRFDVTEAPDLRHAGEKLARLRNLANALSRIAPEWSRPYDSVRRFLTTVEEATR